MRFTAKTRRSWYAKFHPGLHEGVDVRKDYFLQNQNYLDA